MPLNAEEKKKIVESFGLKKEDTGSAAVQAALLSENIKRLTEHMKANHKDFASKRGLLRMVSRRRHLLKYLERVDEGQYREVIKRLGLKR